MSIIDKASRVLQLEIAELQRLEARLRGDESFEKAVAVILECLSRKCKVVVCGVGKSGCIGGKIAATLTSIGCPAVVLDPVNALHGDLGVVGEGDVFLALSYSGETDELLAILPALARMGVSLISMTGQLRSTLAQQSVVVLDVTVEREACPLELAPTASTTVMLALGDALAMVILEVRGFTREDFAKYHPAGRLGRTLLLKVSDVMRGVEQIALVSSEMTVREVLVEMNHKRVGAAVIVDCKGCMEGIFTHGDFARYFETVMEIAGRPVGDFMTRTPVTVEVERMAAEVLLVLERHRVDEVVVVDRMGAPVGLVDSQDLARWRLV